MCYRDASKIYDNIKYDKTCVTASKKEASDVFFLLRNIKIVRENKEMCKKEKREELVCHIMKIFNRHT